MFRQAKEGRTWYTLDLGTAAEKMEQERSRLVRAIEYMAQQGWVELQVADVRQQCSILQRPPDAAELVSTLLKGLIPIWNLWPA
jgi:ATP-dependent DNA helicase RecQ